MHLVFLNQYYPPDVAPTGVMLESLVRGLADEGHEVTVICAGGGYAGQASAVAAEDQVTPASLATGKVRVIRVGASRFGRGSFVGKLLDYASFYAGVIWHLLTLRPRPERVVALTTPPYLSLLARVFSKIRGGDHAHWVMDLYPDVMVAHGMLGEGSAGHRALAALTRWGFGGRRCAAVVTLGPDMAERVGNHTPAKVEWVPLWGSGRGATGETIESETEMAALALRRQRGWHAGELVVMYSGNMGLGPEVFGMVCAVT
jgi:colanic acid biosynthesis glycosyl transferase WcaI